MRRARVHPAVAALLSLLASAIVGGSAAAQDALRFPKPDRPVARIITPRYSTEEARDRHGEAQMIPNTFTQRGHGKLAAEIDQQIDRMRRQIDYHLAHARSAAAASASPAARASIALSAEGLVRVLQRLHAEQGLRIEIDAPTSHAFRGQREDLDEMLGNLLDNACKWARTQVRLTCSKEGEQIVIAVDDDGPGIELSIEKPLCSHSPGSPSHSETARTA